MSTPGRMRLGCTQTGERRHRCAPTSGSVLTELPDDRVDLRFGDFDIVAADRARRRLAISVGFEKCAAFREQPACLRRHGRTAFSHRALSGLFAGPPERVRPQLSCVLPAYGFVSPSSSPPSGGRRVEALATRTVAAAGLQAHASRGVQYCPDVNQATNQWRRRRPERRQPHGAMCRPTIPACGPALAAESREQGGL